MLYSLDTRRDRLLTNSPCTQTSGAELPSKVGSLHEGSSVRLTQPSIGEVPTAALESCRLVPRWSSLQVPSRDIRASGHASCRVHKTTFPQPMADRRESPIPVPETRSVFPPRAERTAFRYRDVRLQSRSFARWKQSLRRSPSSIRLC